MSRRRELSAQDYIDGVLASHRTILARAITLIESNAPRHRALAQEVLGELLPHTGGSIRVGVTGVPGVGKSTFIEALGLKLVESGKRLAVLAVDPTSTVRGGSILGDKTRMTKLSTEPSAFIRPSPSQGSLGGVHRKTRETLLLCEAAGFDVVLVETVGVGQSETSVAQMVDSFLVLMLAGAGDELQGIKKGILEVADLLAINKADGDNKNKALRARNEYEGALHFLSRLDPDWEVPVKTCSSLTGEGIDEVWNTVMAHRESLQSRGALETKRREQQRKWLWTMVEQELLARLHSHPKIKGMKEELELAVMEGRKAVTLAAEEVLREFV